MKTIKSIFIVVLFALAAAGCDSTSGVEVGSLTPDTSQAGAVIATEERRVAVVYSETSAANYFDEFAFGQLYTAMQHQAMQAGIPYDLLTEQQLTNANTLIQYDALIIPLLSHVQRDRRSAIINSLQAAQSNGTAIITASEFLTYDQNNEPFANPYSAMIDLLGLTPNAYHVGVPAKLTIATNTHPVTERYTPNETISDYEQTWFAEFSAIEQSQATTLVETRIDNASTVAVQALERDARVVHFANDEFIADKNLLWSAIRWAVYGDTAPVSLQPSRSPSVFIARNDMDQAMVPATLHENEFPLLDIIQDWKRDYNFVGSYYIDIGNDPIRGYYTNWGVSAPLYAQYLELGNEFGTHSWTHPHYTSELTDAELEFEFNQSRQEISTQLNIDVIGGAVPGNPENLNVVENLNQWFDYFSGRSITGAVGYRSGFGFLNPQHSMRYFNLNMTPDFGLIDFLNHTPGQAEAIWKKEVDALLHHAEMPVMHWLWHDYGPTAETVKGRYSKPMFENTLKHAYQNGSEFVTLADYHHRLNAFESATFSTGSSGAISASLQGTGLGQFALKMDKGTSISSVANWYAFNEHQVFVPDNGGDFVINTGETPADVTRIAELPMRARLISVEGNANELSFTFEGQGSVEVVLSAAMKNNVRVSGADSFKSAGNSLELEFNNIGSHSVSLTAINPVNSPPVANNASVTADYATPVVVDLVASDPNQDALSFRVVQAPLFGELSGAAPKLTYTPFDDFTGTDSFNFVVSDGVFDSASATIAVSVNAPAVAKPPPVANRAVYATSAGQAVAVQLSGSDDDGANLQYTVVTQPASGTLTGAAPMLTYQPASGFVGSDEFTFTVSDGQLTSAPATVVVHSSAQPLPSNGTVSNAATGLLVDGNLNDWSAYSAFVPDPEEALSASFIDWRQAWMAHDATAFYLAYEHYDNVSLNWRSQVFLDTDTNRNTGFTGFGNEYPIGVDFLVEGNSVLQYTGSGTDWSWSFLGAINAVASGNVVELTVPKSMLGNSTNIHLFFSSIDVNSVYDFYPDDANNDTAVPYARQFSYSVANNPNPANGAPVANPSLHSTANNADIPITLTGYDADGDKLSFQLVGLPLHGTLSGTEPNIVYMPSGGYVGRDTFTFTANDGALSSNTATVIVDVVSPPVADSIPIAHNKSIVTDAGSSVVVTLTGSDLEGSPLSYSVADSPQNGSLSGQAPNLTYTPNIGFNGTDAFTYTVNDGTSSSQKASVSVTVGNAISNTPPVAINQSLTTAFETAFSIVLSGTDAESDALTFKVSKQPSAGVLSGTLPNLTYTPFSSVSGLDSFTFTVNDGVNESAPATITVDIKPEVVVNTPPVAIGQALTTEFNKPISITLTGTDAQSNSVAFRIEQSSFAGTLSGALPNLTYTPNPGFSGIDQFVFVASDGELDSNPSVVTIEVGTNPNAVVSNLVDGMNIDGALNDWVGLNAFENDPDDIAGPNNPLNWRSMMMAHDSDNFYFLFRNDGPFSLSWGHGMYIDVDGNTETGFREFSNESPIGADYLIEGNNVHVYTGTGNDWSWNYVGTATSALQHDILEFALPRSMLGNPVNVQLYLQATNAPFGGAAIDHYPDAALDSSAPAALRVLRYSTTP